MEEVESSIDDETVENNPELHPLKEALQRAQARWDEAIGIRVAMEAEVSMGGLRAVGDTWWGI